MTQSNEPMIIEMNRAICEFMGWEFRPDGGDWFKAYHDGHLMWAESGKGLNEILLEGFKFHEDWNKLMPVVEKIRGMGYHIEITISVDCSVEILKLRGDPEKDVLRIIAYSTPINAVYTSVYQFITWYNQQKQKDG